MGELFGALLNRRRDEKHVAYAESHDQALVGDQTLAFRLMGPEMYWNMEKGSRSLVVDRGIALHKLIRLLTFSVAGEGWLSFMGNEFGHPEWVDFPREGNGWSFQHARRQWSLADARRPALPRADGARHRHAAARRALRAAGRSQLIELLSIHEEHKQLVYRRGRLLFAFNFHPLASYEGLRVPLPENVDYRVVLDTDQPLFEGFGRCQPDASFPVQGVPLGSKLKSLQLYLPSRSALVLAPVTLR